jgi:hypothetical protein
LSFAFTLILHAQSDSGTRLGTINGQVFDQTKTPLSGALVLVGDGAGKESCRTYSSAEGSFSCAKIPPGEYRVEITAPGFSRHTQQRVSITAENPS